MTAFTALDNHIRFEGHVQLPDGSGVWASITGYVEGATNGWVEQEATYWDYSGEDLTSDQLNEVITDPETGRTLYLHEWVYELAFS